MINNDTCQGVGPLLQNYINYSELTWLQNLLSEQAQKTHGSKIRVIPAVSERSYKVAKPVQEALSLCVPAAHFRTPTTVHGTLLGQCSVCGIPL